MFMLGFCICGACALVLQRYDKDDAANAMMMFIVENSLQAFLRLITIRTLGRMLVLYAVCHALTVWTGIT